MQVHNLVQGSQDWMQFRLEHRGASEIAAVLGLSKTTTRDELLHMKHTGLTKEFSEWVQEHVLNFGHIVEGETLPLIESLIGDDLYPATCSEGNLSASCDGLTMSGEIAWENKQPNIEIVAQMRAGQMPEQHMPQCQQVLLVTGAKKLIFSVSDGTPETLLTLEVFPDPAWFERIKAAWNQFDIDLAAYVPPAVSAPAPTGRAPETLPALFATVKGEVTASNLAEFKEVALTAIRSVNRDLKTDQDFADADKAVKWCEDIESRVAGAKEHALSQTVSIDALFKAYDDISAEARQVRLDLSKLVTARKTSLKTELLTEKQTELGDYLRECNARIGKDYMPQIKVDFAGAIAGKRSFDLMRSALNTALANAKIEASAKADLIQKNIATLQELATEHRFLFGDTKDIVLKANDDLTSLVKARIADHDKAEADRLEKQRAAIREEERVKAEAEARDKVLAEQEAQRKADEAAKPAPVAQQVAAPAPAPSSAPVQESAARQVREFVSQATAAAPSPAPVAAVAKPSGPPTLKLGEINSRLQYMSVTAAQLAALGFEPAAREKSAVLFHEHQYADICAALIQKLHEVSELQTA